MGGQGSSRWGQFYERKTPVEECLLLDVRKLKAALSKLPEASSGSCRAVRISTGKLKTVGYVVDPVGGLEQEPMVTLSYALSKDYSEEGGPLVEIASAYVRRDPFGPRVELRVELLSTEPNFGGRRWYFRCPLVREDGRVCDGRVAKLWLPKGQRFFGCTACHDLTHKSSLECHDFDRWAKELADRAPDQEWAEVAEREYKAAMREAVKEGRKRKEHKKDLRELFDERLGDVWTPTG